MAGLGIGAPIVKVYHEKSIILPDVSRVLACLYEKDIKFQTQTTSSFKGLLRLQASSHVPVPFDDGLTFLEESREICRYIAETYDHQGYPFLLGKDSLERASIEQWLHHEEHNFNPPSRSLFCHLAFPLAEEDDDIDLQKRKLEEVLEVYEQRLGDSEFLAGNKFTLADLVHLPNSHYITESDKFAYLYDSRKNVQRWWNAISTRKSWQNVLTDIQVVEQQRKQEEFEKQQQRQWLRERPPNTRRKIRLDSRKQTSTKPQTILVPSPVDIISTSPTASQVEKPFPTKTFPAEALSTPTTHKSPSVQSKHTTVFTTHRETPAAPVQSTPRLPGYSHIPVQSTSNSFTPATSPTTAENPSRTSADKSKTRGLSLPSEATEIDLPGNSKRSSSKEVSHNLRVFNFYEASSHTDEAEPYTEPTPQKSSEVLDRISGTDGPSNATDHVKTGARSAKEDSGASDFWIDNTATNADTLDKKSDGYTETIYGRSTDQRATYTSPGKHGSTEAHQKLQTEEWHRTAAGLSNLKGETDYSMPTQQVKPGKDVRNGSSQDSEQIITHPLAEEPVSMDRQLVQGPGMTPRTPYTDQKKDVSSMLWQKTADVRGIAEEDKASSDNTDAVLSSYARKHAEETKRVKDEDTQSIPFQTAYDDAHDIAQEARETASAPRRRTQDAYDTSEVIETYHSSSSRPQPINVPQHAAPPSKQAASKGPRRATAPYPAAQEFIKQGRESPASRSTVRHDTQGSTEEETGESSASKAHPSGSGLTDARPLKEFLDEDHYGSVAPLQTGYAPKQMISQDASEEMKMTDSASFEAQTFDHQQAGAPPQQQRPAEDVQTTASPWKKRYSAGEDTTKHSKDAASRPGRMAAQEVQDNFKETKAGDSLSTREPPSDTWRAHPALPRHQVADDHSTTAPTQKRYPGTRGTIKEVEEIASMPRRMAGEDAKEALEETKFAEAASPEAQPLYYQRTDAPSRKQEAIEDRLGATSPLERRYADAKDTTKHSRDTALPRKIVGQDAEDTSEEAEAEARKFRAQPQDARRVPTTPSKQAAEDALSVSRSSPKRYPRAEETSKQPRGIAPKPTHIAAQDARDIFTESKVADSTPSIEQPSDSRVAASFEKQEIPDARNTSASFQKTYPDVKGATKKSKVTFEETESPDSASSRVQPLDTRRDYAPSWKKEATEAPRATSPLKKRDSYVEDTAKRSGGAPKPRQMVGQDTQGTYEETKASDFGLPREQSSYTWQATNTPTEKVATEDDPGRTPPSERNAPSDEDTTTRPRGTASAPRRTTAGDASGSFQESKPADSVSSREQPLSARQPVVTPSRQETEDSLSKISAFHKTRPFVEDSTRPAVDTVFGPRQVGAEDTKDITEEAKVPDSASSVGARPTFTPRNAHPLSEQAEVEEDEETSKKPRGAASKPTHIEAQDARDIFTESKVADSAPRQTTVGDASGSFQESKPADSVPSREQPLSARQPVVTPSRQETEDSLSKISAFHKTRPFVEDSTRPGVDTVFGPRQVGAEDTKDITEETKVPDSASSVGARPTFTPRNARPLSEQAEVEEDARDKDREGRETFSAPKKMVSRDSEDSYGERKTPHSASTEQLLDNLQTSSPLKQAAAEDSRGATKGAKESLVDETKHSRGFKGASKKPVGTFEETKDPGSRLPTTQPVSAQDAQHTGRSSRTPTAEQWKDAPTQLQSNLQEEAKSSSARQKGLGSSPSESEAGDDNQAIMGEKVFSPEQLRKMPKESRSASSKAQPADSLSLTKVERMPSVYQEDHLVAPDSRKQPQTLPTSVRADGSTPKHQQGPVIPSTSEEKSTPPTPPRAKAHSDHTTEEPVKRDTLDDPKGAALLSGREPTSQVQHATEPTPDGDLSSKPSTIDKWRLASAPIQGVTPNSGDSVLGVPTIDQKPTPMSQQSVPSAQGANESVKREQRMVPSAPAGAQTPEVQHAPPSFAGADMAERDGEPVQMQAPTLHARPPSVPTRRASPDARDTGDNEFASTSDAQRWKALKAKHDSAMIDENVPDASLSTHDASEAQVSDSLPGSTATPVNARPTSVDKLVERLAPDQGGKPPESAQAETRFDAPGDSVSPQGVPSDALDETKIAKPSSTGGMGPTAGSASTLEAQLAEHKFAPADKRSARAAQPLSSVETRKEDSSVSAADQTKKPQTIFRQESRPSTPITKQVPSSNAYHDTRKIQQVTLDNLSMDDSPTPHVPSYEQVSHTPQTIPSERDMTRTPDTGGSPASDTQIASEKLQEAIPDNYRPDELTVPSPSSEKQGSYAGSSTEPHDGPSHDAHGAADDKDITKYPSKQAPVLEYRPETSDDSYVRPTSGDEPGISPGQGAESPTAAQATNSEDRHNEVFPAEKKSTVSDQDSVHSVQQHSPAETRKGETIVAAAEQTLPTNIGQQHTHDMRDDPASYFVPAEEPSDAQSGRPDEVVLAEQKFTSSDQDTQLTSSVEPRNEEIRNSTRSAQPLFPAEDYQTNDPQTTIGQQDIAPIPGPSKSPSSGKFQEVAPDDNHTVESLPNQGQISRAKPSFVLSEGPTHDSHNDINKNTTKLPSSQPQSSDPRPDPTQNRSDEAPTKQHAETQAPPPLVGPYDSKSSQNGTSDTLGKAESPEPSSIDQEAMNSALTPDTHLGSAPREVTPAGQKLLLKDQDSAHPTEKSSSSEPAKEQTTFAAPNEAKTSPTIFSQQDIALAQTKMKDPSSGSQYVPQRLQEITPEDQRTTGSTPMQQQVPHFEHISKPNDGPTPDPHGAFVKEPMAHTTSPTPHVQYGMAQTGLSPDEEKPDISDKDSERQTQLRSSAESRKEERDVDASDQTIMPAPHTGQSLGEVLEVSPDTHQSSELTRPTIPSRKQDSHEGPNSDAHRAVADENRRPPLVSQARTLETGLNSAPFSDDVIPTSGDEPVTGLTNEQKKQTPEAFQAPLPPEALYDSIYPKSVSADAFGEVGPLKATGKVTPADQRIAPSEPLPVVESRKESTGAESEESKVFQPVTGQKDIRHAPGISESVLDDDRNKEPSSREEHVSHDQSASEPREGSPPSVHRGSLDEKTTPPSSKAHSSDPKIDALPKSVDVNPSSGEQPTTRSSHGHGLTRSPPLHESLVYPESNEDVPEFFKPDTMLGTTSDEIAPDRLNLPLPAQELARSAQQPLSVEPTKEKGIVTSSDQTDESRTIIGQGRVTPSTNKEKTPFDLQGSELAKPPNEDQQVRAGSAYEEHEGPNRDARGAVDEKVPHPSSQAGSSDSVPDSATISGDTHRTNVDVPDQELLTPIPEEKPKQQQKIGRSSTRSSEDDSIEARRTANPNILTRSGNIQQPPVKESMQEAQVSRNQQHADQVVSQSTQENEMQIKETEAQDNGSDEPEDSAPISGTSSDGPTTSSLPDSQSQPPPGTLNVPAVFLEKIEPPRRPMTSPAPAPDTQQDGDSTQSPQLSPSVVSRKHVADANQTDVPQAGLRVPGSSDATLSSHKIQEFIPDASVTKSGKQLLPMTGTDPVQQPREASVDLSSDGKPTMIRGKQANTASNVSLSASQEVGLSENSAVKRPFSEESVSLFSQKNLERTLPAEKSKQKQQTDQSSTRSSNDESVEASGTANPNILTTGDLQPSPLKDIMHATEGSRNQEQAEEAVFQSTQDNEKQIQANVAQEIGSYRPEEIKPDSASASGDTRRTSGHLPATRSLRDSQEQPPTGAPNVPAVFLEKMEPPRVPSTDEELMTSKTSPALGRDAPQGLDSTRSPQLPPSVISRKDVANADRTNVSQAGLREPATSDVTRPSVETQQISPDANLAKSEKPVLSVEGSNLVQTAHEASFDLSSVEKPNMIKGEKANTISNVSLSASQPVGQSENSAVKGPLPGDLVSSFSQKNFERTLPQEKSKQHQQTDQPSTRSSTDDSIEASGIRSPNILTTSGDVRPSPPKENMQAAQGSRNQEQTGQTVVQSMQDTEKQIEETEAQDNGSDEPKRIRPDSAPISGDAGRTIDNGPGTSSFRDSRAQPPAGSLNVPAVFLENVDSPRLPSTDQETMTSMTSPAPAPDSRQGTAPREAATDKDSTQSPQLSSSVVSRKDVANADQTNVPQAGLREPASSDTARPSVERQEISSDANLAKPAKPLLPMTGADPVQPPEASFDLSTDGKPTMVKGDQGNTVPNVSLSASQAAGQSENNAVKAPLSEDLVSPFYQKSLGGTSTEEKSNQKTERSNTSRSSKEDNIVEARGTTDPNISTSGDILPPPLKESTQAAEGSRDQRPADQDVFESTLDDEKQFEETEARVIGPDELYDTNLQKSTNQNNNVPSQMDALEQPRERVPAVQPRSNDTYTGSEQTKEAPGRIPEDKKSDSSSRTSEESEKQVQTEGKNQGGETKAIASRTELPEGRDLPSRNEGVSSKSQTETPYKLDEQTSSGIQNRDTNSSKLGGSTDEMRSADTDDNPPSP
ncbi:mucin-12-like isoform X2 [Lolium rigidum]|uniref:mucin-12-like isoform X2 n=1 Tax=Lolium rigidum TaxID=89674 RepID=UPI001F5CD562|nr:mucin-12-like isoform X2 [Lolium rigidum]